jgi:hypothetical protein
MSRIKGGDNIISAASTGLKKLREMLDRQIAEANTARQQSEVEQHGQTLKGYHYSKAGENLDRLSGEKYGTGMPGEELMRVMQPQNDDIRSRVYFYPDPKTPAGKANNTPGMRTPEPESGVGPQIYRVKVPGVYDLKADPLKLRAAFGSDRSGLEREIKRRGFTGYVNPTSGAAVALVDELPAQKLGPYRPDVETALKAEQRMQNPFLVTAEMVPSTKTPLGDALVKAPLPLRKEYTDRKAEILYDTTYGPAPVGDVRGTSAFPGYGTFEGNLNPNVILRVSGPNKAKRLADASGGLAQQDAVPFMRPDFDNPPSADTPVGVRVTTRGGVGPQEMGEIFAETGEDMTRSALDQLEFVNFRGADNNEFVDNVANYFINRNIASDINPYSLDPRGSYNETGDQWARFGRDPANPGAVPPAMEDTVGRIEDLDREFKKRLGVAGAAGATTAALIGAGGTVAPEQAQAGVISNIPAAGRAILDQFGNPRLLDHSNLAAVPSVEQSALERVLPPRGQPKGIGQYLTNENSTRLMDIAKRGEDAGGREWYNTMPLRDQFMAQLGPEEGAAQFGRYMDFIAATSPRSKVDANIRRGSLFLNRERAGLPVAELTNADMPPGYGHLAHETQNHLLRDLQGGGHFSSLTRPKTSSFAENLKGNQAPMTIDTHNMKAVTGLNRSPSNTEYRYLEGYQAELADRLGMTPAQWQASVWMGADTGVADPRPFLEVFDDVVARTAQRNGVSKQQALADFIGGKAPLYGLAGITAAGAMAPDSAQAAAPLPIQEQSEFQRRQTARAPVMTQLRTASLEVASTALRGLEAVGQQISAGIEALNNSPFVMPMVKPDNMMAGLEALDMPLQGLYGLAAGGIALGQGDDVTSALDRAANVARQPLEQTAYDVGGAVTDATGSPGLGAAANVLTLSPDLIMAGKALPGGLKRLGVLAR